MLKYKNFYVFVLFYCLTRIVESVDKSLEAKFTELCQLEKGIEKNEYTDCFDVPSSQVLDDRIQQEKLQLRCGFKFIALSFLRLTEILLKWYGDDTLIDKAVEKISLFSKYARKMLIILYNAQFIELNDMWLFYLYTTEVAEYRKRFNNLNVNSIDQLLKLREMHKKVKEYITHHMKHCKNDRYVFDITSNLSPLFRDFKKLNLTVNYAAYEEATRLTTNYSKDVSRFMKRNNQYQLSKDNGHIFTTNHLYINHVGDEKNCENLNSLINLFDINIEVGNLAETLHKFYKQAKFNPISLYDGLKRIKMYHEFYKNILKSIVLRIVLTHSTMIDKVIEGHKDWLIDFYHLGTKTHLKQVNSGLVVILKKFANLTNIVSDEEFMTLISFLERTNVDLITYKEDLRKMIINQLEKMPPIENFNIMAEPIKEAGLTDMMESLVLTAKTYQLPTKFSDSILKNYNDISNNYFRANTFVSIVEKLLTDVDLKVFQNIFTYSKPTKCTELNSFEYGGEISEQTENHSN